MSGDECVQVNLDEMRSHAKSVDEIGGRVDVAADAGAHVATLDDAYGIFCQAFGTMLQQPQQRGVEAIRSSVTAMKSMTDKLNACADAYEEVDKKFVQALQDILDQLGGATGARKGGVR